MHNSSYLIVAVCGMSDGYEGVLFIVSSCTSNHKKLLAELGQRLGTQELVGSIRHVQLIVLSQLHGQ